MNDMLNMTENLVIIIRSYSELCETRHIESRFTMCVVIFPKQETEFLLNNILLQPSIQK